MPHFYVIKAVSQALKDYIVQHFWGCMPLSGKLLLWGAP